jgi:hypothetical protein
MRNFALTLLVLATACSSSDSVDSNEQARRAYLGLDKSISKSLTLGFSGYNAASNANIPAQMTMGDKAGTLTITGKVDQGNCSQLGMTLDVGMVKYSDGPVVIDKDNHTVTITYDTSTDVAMQPVLALKMNASSGNSITGTLTGDYTMTGDIKGTVTLDLTITGTFMGSCTAQLSRVAGGTTVTGTAVNSSGGMYQINITI